MADWLSLNWYLVIPWVLGLGAWLAARQHRTRQPLLWAAVGFLIGSAVVLTIDLWPKRFPP
jgi:hypothetical protein